MGQALQGITPQSDDMEDERAVVFSPLSASVMNKGFPLSASARNPREHENDDCRSVHSFDDDQVVTCHSFIETPKISKGIFNQKDLAKSVAQLADTFETFEFMLDTSVSSVATYGVGFSDDHRHQILKLKTEKEKLEKEEEYRRGLITNSMLTLSQIIQMAAAQIMPALVTLQSVDMTERGKFKKQLTTRGRAGSFIAPQPQYDEYGNYTGNTVTIYNKDLNLSRNRRGAPTTSPSENGAAFSPANTSIHDRSGLSHSGLLPTSGPSSKADPKMVEFFQRLSGASIDAFKHKATAKVIPDWSLHTSQPMEKAIEHLNRGDAYFHFLCRPLTSCNQEDLTVFQSFVNVSNFEDELRDNNCPVVDVFDEEQKPMYQVIGVKAVYILPGVDYRNISKTIMSTQEYNKACQPGDCKFFEVDTPFTFRQTKGVVKYIYSITVQFLVGEINDAATLEQFTSIEGIRPSKVIFLERTKRNVSKTDSTAKVRSVLLYYPVEQGVFVSHHTVVLSTSIPGAVAKIVNNFGSQGAAESAETADLTRRFLLKHFGDTRK